MNISKELITELIKTVKDGVDAGPFGRIELMDKSLNRNINLVALEIFKATYQICLTGIIQEKLQKNRNTEIK